MPLRASRRILVPALSLLILAGPTHAATPFFTELVDSGEFAGYYTSIALDSRSQPVVAYQVAISGDLRLATRVSGAWNVEIVDGSALVGFYASLKLDSQDNPHIAYYDFTNRRLKYAVKVGGSWTIEIVDNAGAVGMYCSLALDGLDRPLISYFDRSGGNLKYAFRSGTWTKQTVDATGVVGQHTSLAVTAEGYPHISYYDSTNANLKFASNLNGWEIENVDNGPEDAGAPSAVVLDATSGPHIAYARGGGLLYARRHSTFNNQWTVEDSNLPCDGQVAIDLGADGEPRITSLHRYGLSHNLGYMVRNVGNWSWETVERTGSNGEYCSLVLDHQGNPYTSYYDSENGDLKVANAAVHLDAPSGAETWPVGALREIRWSGVGPVSLELSVDGGRSYAPLLESIVGNRLQLRVPHAPTRFAQLRVRRETPFSTSESESLFTIQANIALLAIAAQAPPAGDPGVLVTWRTDPAPEDLGGYRIERASGSGAWQTIASDIRQSRYLDLAGGPGARYRLFAANGLGAEQLLGEVSVHPGGVLSAWPLPYRGGTLNVSFATAGGLGGGAGAARVGLYDAGGRLVRSIASGSFTAGRHAASWDGRDGRGRRSQPGIYYLVADSGGETSRVKIVVLP